MPEHGNDAGDDLYFWGSPRADERIISYDLPSEECPDGMKVRYVFSVVSGDRAKKIDARQAKAVMEVLEWYRQQRDLHEQAQDGQ